MDRQVTGGTPASEATAPRERGRAPIIFTIGYEGRHPDDFVATLKRHGVEVLVDIRELPLSRRRGFSKTALVDLLQRQDVRYRHVRQLGSPREMRHEARRTGDLARFFRAFSRYLDGQKESLQQLAAEASRTRICLLCFEADHTCCHRHTVASKLRGLSRATISHL